jgi:hypothetical protein
MFIRDKIIALGRTIDEAQKIVVRTGDPRTRTAVDLLGCSIEQLDSILDMPKPGETQRKGLIRVRGAWA